MLIHPELGRFAHELVPKMHRQARANEEAHHWYDASHVISKYYRERVEWLRDLAAASECSTLCH